FIPEPENMEQLSPPTSFKLTPSGTLEPELTLDYLKWRFFTYPVSEYIYIDELDYSALARVGFRGNLKEVQVLFLNLKGDTLRFSGLLAKLKSQTDYDLISFP